MLNLTLRQKLWLPLVLSWIALGALSALSAWQERGIQLNARRLELADLVDMSYTIAADLDKQAKAGKMTEDDAKAQAIARITAQRYSDNGYVTIVGSDSVMVSHPIMPNLNGKNMIDWKDAKGTALYRDIAAKSSSATHQGYLHYWWPRPGQTKSAEKLGFVKRYVPWGWDFIAGAYVDDLDDEFYEALIRAGVVLLVFGGVLSAIAAWVTKNVLSSLGGEPVAAARAARQIAAGHLDTPIELHRGDRSSLLHALADMRDGLRQLVARIKHVAENITTASGGIAAGNDDLRSRTEQQAAALQQAAAGMDQLSSSVKVNAEHAGNAARLAADASAIAARGGDVVGHVIERMRGISQSSRKIGEIIALIDGIAFQTNILALNAAVEAARAGEQGRGFAVVAGEVRNLAQRSASAAKEIKALIDSSVAEVEDGSMLVEQAGTTMGEVVGAVARVSAIIDEISGAFGEQSAGLAEMNVAIRQMDGVMQQNVALVHEAAEAARSLDGQVHHLHDAVAAFTIETR